MNLAKPTRIKHLLPLLLLLLGSCKQKDSTLFTSLPASATGIHFNNVITENDSINPIDMEFLYNGGGVAVGDFNRDSLPDLYFTASQSSNKLYLNKGGFSFQDITETANATGEGRWSNAASVVDINNDGWPDIYVCATIHKDPAQRRNLLYINQGQQPDGLPRFKEMAASYNLADTNFSVHAAFFDYDNDGDLDLYLVNTKLAQRKSSRFDGGSTENKAPLRDKLFRNEGTDPLKGHPVFKDVSDSAGIMDDGYGLGVAIADLNGDGWKDIYVTNDFYTSDLLYINQQNGRFVNTIAHSLKHSSQNAMGNDVADFNNDGLPDIIAVDMNPEDNYRKKKNLGDNNYFLYQSMVQGELMLQYIRNTLQLNTGSINDSTGIPVPLFSDIGYMAGVAETDWSWSSLFADFDNDGYKDLLITNGYPKDITDHDFAAFRANSAATVSKQDLLKEIPQIRIPNYAYRNSGQFHFENVTRKWGMDQPSFSCGAAYADLDLDGDLDYIINNINEPALLYRNNSQLNVDSSHYLSISFKGPAGNTFGIGAVAKLYSNQGKAQVLENSPYRGYLSCMETVLHFGLGKATDIDSLVIQWPGGKQQKILHPSIDKRMVVTYNDAQEAYTATDPHQGYFTDITAQQQLQFAHEETDYIDFDVQRLLPHKLSEYGPALAIADVDGNGLDDIFVGSSYGYDPAFLMQQSNGRFIKKLLPPSLFTEIRKPEVMGALLFDADGDGDNDLYLVSGSNQSIEGSKDYQDRLYVNDGNGNFSFQITALPAITSSKSCIKAADFDKDGDLDLFVGGRVIPGKYPLPADSYIFRNDSKNGLVRFTDVTKDLAPGLQKLGMVCDATWSDYDNDGWPDLVIAGEWMALQFFHNENGKFNNASANTGISQWSGWWNSVLSADFDNDGDMDYIAGNLGLNSFYRADSLHPVRVYSHDFLKNGQQTLLPSIYLPDQQGNRKEYPAYSRDDVTGQLPGLKKKFLTYKSFGEATISDLFSKEDLDKAYQRAANYFSSAYVENKGNGKFQLHPLPEIAQTAPLNGMLADDINADGFLDLVLVGNDYGTEVSSGRFDAFNGLVLLGNGQGNFTPVSIAQSGFLVQGNAKALVKLRGPGNSYWIAASQNKSWLKLFRLPTRAGQLASLQPDDIAIFYMLKNGKIRKEEACYGQSFLSQSARFITLDSTVSKVEIINRSGARRELKPSN